MADNLIKYFNAKTKKFETEKVYGESAVSFIYGSNFGKFLWPVISKDIVSRAYGSYQNFFLSRYKVDQFVKKFNINLTDFLPSERGNSRFPYPNFNEFFIRRFRPGKRVFENVAGNFPAPSEARYLGFNSIDLETKFPVKGSFLSAESLLQNDKWSQFFEGGPLFIARLCPVDYHRFHYPDGGNIVDNWHIKGPLHSVNPMALKLKEDIFCTNERVVSILETENFGKLAYIEVGATCVGKIVQSARIDKPFQRGDEKGYFLFGGSTVIIIGEKGKWKIDETMISNTKKMIETWYPLGMKIGEKL